MGSKLESYYFIFIILYLAGFLFSIILSISLTSNIEFRKELFDTAKKLKFLYDSAPSAIISMNEKFEITYWSKVAYEMFKIDEKKKVVGKTIGEVVPFISTLSRLKKIDENINTPFTIESDGKTYSIIIGSWKTNEVNYSLFIREISDEIELQQKLELEEEKHLHASKLSNLGEMAAGIAHEINNPLAIIKGYLGQLEKMVQMKEFPPDKVEKIIVTCSSACERASKIIRGMRFFAKDASSEKFQYSELSSILEETNLLLGNTLKESEVEFKLEAEDRSVVIYCRAVQICQVLVNLIKNAIEAFDTYKDNKNKVIRF